MAVSLSSSSRGVRGCRFHEGKRRYLSILCCSAAPSFSTARAVLLAGASFDAYAPLVPGSIALSDPSGTVTHVTASSFFTQVCKGFVKVSVAAGKVQGCIEKLGPEISLQLAFTSPVFPSCQEGKTRGAGGLLSARKLRYDWREENFYFAVSGDTAFLDLLAFPAKFQSSSIIPSSPTPSSSANVVLAQGRCAIDVREQAEGKEQKIILTCADGTSTFEVRAVYRMLPFQGTEEEETPPPCLSALCAESLFRTEEEERWGWSRDKSISKVGKLNDFQLDNLCRRRSIYVGAGMTKEEKTERLITTWEMDAVLERTHAIESMSKKLMGQEVVELFRNLKGIGQGDFSGAIREGVSSYVSELTQGDQQSFVSFDEKLGQRLTDVTLKAMKVGSVQLAAGQALMSVAEGSAWATLVNATSEEEDGIIMNPNLYERVAFLENIPTDTQIMVWRGIDPSQGLRRIVVAFRGTEVAKWQDVVTDLMLAPTEIDQFLDDYPELNGRDFLVHSGFAQAYVSIRKGLFEVMDAILATETGDDNVNPSAKPWEIYVTGHSLGGALATLFSFDFSCYLKKTREAEKNSLASYTFGCPRVGNESFTSVYDEVVKDSWRIFNKRDVVPTVPRLLGYKHVKTGVCMDTESMSLKIGAACRGDAECAGVEADPLTGSADVTKMFQGTSFDSLFELELAKLNELIAGDAVAEHMEDLYFSMIQRVVLDMVKQRK